jgi:hypothetical protein
MAYPGGGGGSKGRSSPSFIASSGVRNGITNCPVGDISAPFGAIVTGPKAVHSLHETVK